MLNENPSNSNDAIILIKTLILEFYMGLSNVSEITSLGLVAKKIFIYYLVSVF